VTLPNDQPAYAAAGVDQNVANSSVKAIVDELAQIQLGEPARQLDTGGLFAAVLRLTDDLCIALSTDGVGTKLAIAEDLGRFDTVGIDCVAMNVNDVICVGAKPIAMLDYLGVRSADPAFARSIAIGLREGAERASIEIPGGELAQLGDTLAGFDLVGSCFGLVARDQVITGNRIQVGDAVLGLPSSGLHANGYTLARRALSNIPYDDTRLGETLGEILLRPTEIYVKPVLALLASPVDVRGLAHITSDGLENLQRLHTDVGYKIDSPLPVPEVFKLIQESASVESEEMDRVFNMGCGFCCVVASEHEAQALEILHRHYPDAQRIGTTTAEPGISH
jgi:phosphoribosylformylglycinamidine cyclo-ligase